MGRLAQVGGVALDARRVVRLQSGGELADAARWIAGDFLAALGVRVRIDGEVPTAPGLVAIRARDLAGFVAALAAVPAIVDGDTLPVRWRVALRFLGMPLCATSGPAAAGASVAVLATPRWSLTGAAACTVTVGEDAQGYRVRVAPVARACLPAA